MGFGFVIVLYYSSSLLFCKVQSFAYGSLLSYIWDFKCKQIHNFIQKEKPRNIFWNLCVIFWNLCIISTIRYDRQLLIRQRTQKYQSFYHHSLSPSFQGVVHQQCSMTKLSAWQPLPPDFCRDRTANVEALPTFLPSWGQW